MCTATTANNLPGPDTTTKRDAVEQAICDRRLDYMLDRAAETGWPEAYCDDLYKHDAECLANHPGVAIIWILRDHGTNTILLAPEFKGDSPQPLIDVIRWHSGEHRLNTYTADDPRARYYHITQHGGAKITWQDAEQIVREYYRRCPHCKSADCPSLSIVAKYANHDFDVCQAARAGSTAV